MKITEQNKKAIQELKIEMGTVALTIRNIAERAAGIPGSKGLLKKIELAKAKVSAAAE